MAAASDLPTGFILSGIGILFVTAAVFLFNRAWQGEEVAADWEDERRTSKNAVYLFVVVDTLRGWKYSRAGRWLFSIGALNFAAAAVIHYFTRR